MSVMVPFLQVLFLENLCPGLPTLFPPLNSLKLHQADGRIRPDLMGNFRWVPHFPGSQFPHSDLPGV